jgi:predicted tellurium resistance membrane protein TerC
VWQAVLVLILFAMTLLNLPFLKLVGALLLLLLVWSEVKLLAPDDNDHGNAQDSDRLLADNKTSLVADLVMRVDNLIAIAGAAQNAGEHSALRVVLGLLISVAIIVAAGQLVIKRMARFLFLITLGRMLLGWIAGGTLVTDPVLADPGRWTWMLKIPQSDLLKHAAAVARALLALALSKALAARKPPLKAA